MKYINIEPLLNNVLEIRSNNFQYDLHNDSDFCGVIYEAGSGLVKLIWNYPGKWFIKESQFNNNKEYLRAHNIKAFNQRIILSFEEVSLFEVIPGNPGVLNSDEECLEDIRNFYEDNNGFLKNDESINFVFQSGMEIRIRCSKLTFQIGK